MAGLGGQYEEEIEDFRREYFTHSLTPSHELLIDIAVGNAVPREADLDPNLLCDDSILTRSGLEQLALMVQVEFLESLQRETQGTEDAAVSKMASVPPHPYDVWLMVTTIDQRDRRIAVCMPMRKNKELCWYNGLKDVWTLDPPSHYWRVASLSGPARTLEALQGHGSALMQAAMNRELIVEAIDDDEYADQLLRGRLGEALVNKLNSSQRQAVATLLDPAFQQGFLPLIGPPGTGKSSTLQAMIAAFQQQGGLLVTAPSNAAVANLALRVWETGLFELHELVVYGDNTDESVCFLNPILRGDYFAKIIFGFAEMSDLGQESVRRDLLQWLHMPDADLSIQELSQMCPTIDRNTQEGRRFYGRMIANAKAVFCTLNSSGAAPVRNKATAHTLLLDEAGQCTEAEFYIAATFPGIQRMVVVGDPMQLPATVLHPACKRAGFGRSWLDKVYGEYRTKVHLLDTQYRMDPQILAFPNQAFYANRINSGDNVRGRTPFVEHPFRFIDTDGKGHEESHNFSWRNVYEVTVVKNLIFQDSDIVRLIRDVNNCRVIIITPYKAQAALLRENIKSTRGANLEFATVDSFQGQEGDVVIMVTVRTHKIGFIDDRQRINVALTRARRALRVVGDAQFLSSLGPSSTLRSLVRFAERRHVLDKSKIQSHPWCPPNWNIECMWKPLMSSRFHNSINALSKRDKYICMNTLLALAQGNLKALSGGKIPEKTSASWYMNFLLGHEDKQIVWYAKMMERQVIEAVFAGSRAECLKFMNQTSVPPESCIVSTDLACLLPSELDGQKDEAIEESALILSWPVSNTTQACLLDGSTLPRGSVQLDNFQEDVCRREPPLVIESRSGTGKTLVLLQHAAYHCDVECREKPACFVTVSPGLREELQRRFEEMNEAENLQLPETRFYTFGNILERLLRLKRITDFDERRPCTFLGFKKTRDSYEKEKVEPELVENEIGGVIVGSLAAARQAAPLTREQYREDIRSNIGRKADRHLQLRETIYDEYAMYATWKTDNERYDVGDLVMRLLKEDWGKEYFSSRRCCSFSSTGDWSAPHGLSDICSLLLASLFG